MLLLCILECWNGKRSENLRSSNNKLLLVLSYNDDVVQHYVVLLTIIRIILYDNVNHP